MSLLIILLVLVLDQASKFYIKNMLNEPVQIFSGLFEFTYAENRGIAFSLFSNDALSLTVINTIVIASLVIWAFLNHKLSHGLAFIIAGGIGNLIDRYIYGYVIDFINPLFIDFAIFNIADIALNIGVVVLFWEMASHKNEIE